MALKLLSSTAAPRRLAVTQHEHDAQRLRAERIDVPCLRPIDSARREARIWPFSALTPLSSDPSEQSSTPHDSWGKVRELSFESKLGGFGPVVAGALDRSRRLILTAAAASDGSVQICTEFPYVRTEFPYVGQ